MPKLGYASILQPFLAAAHFCSEFDDFLGKYAKNKSTRNLTRLSKVGIPKGAGKKGDKPPQKRKCPGVVHTVTPPTTSTSSSVSTSSVTSSQSSSSTCQYTVPMAQSPSFATSPGMDPNAGSYVPSPHFFPYPHMYSHGLGPGTDFGMGGSGPPHGSSYHSSSSLHPRGHADEGTSPYYRCEYMYPSGVVMADLRQHQYAPYNYSHPAQSQSMTVPVVRPTQHISPSPTSNSNSFTLRRVSGNIRVCQSCRCSSRNADGSIPGPPRDLCVARLDRVPEVVYLSLLHA